MSVFADRLLHRFMLGWEANFIRHPWLVILLFVVGCGFTLRYTMENLKVNTNTGDMISLELPFQKNRIALERAFPQDIGTALLLVEGQTPESTSAAVTRIAERLRQDTAHFSQVYVPDEGAFFARNGLLFLDLPELENLTNQLANAQPFIGRLAGDNTLRGLFGIIGEALDEAEKSDLALDIDPLLVQVKGALTAATSGKVQPVSWRQLMTPGSSSGLGFTQRMILVKPVLHYEEVMPAEAAIGALNGIIAGASDDLAGVRVRKTGEVMLEHEEMETISTGVSIASAASLVLVCLTLWVAYRSVKLMFATFVSLTMGLILSLGFATVAIGQLNLISIGFAVLFIGMGDAYSSHFCLRYRELILEGRPQREALQETLTSTGSALILSAVTAAIGLFAFIPTSYSGVAELGVIAGASMFIALVTTFTVLPALMKIMPIRMPKMASVPEAGSANHFNWPLRYAKTVRVATVLLAVIAGVIALNVQVDFNPVNLRDPKTESVETFNDLLRSRDTSPMTLAALAQGDEAANRLEEKFLKLPSVDKVVSLRDLIPADQDEKLSMISDLALMMGSQLDAFPPPADGGATREVVLRLHESVRRALGAGSRLGALPALDDALTRFETALDAAGSDEARQVLLDNLQASLLNPLPAVIHDLSESLKAEPITRESLPADLVERWVSADGLYRLQIFPKKDLGELANLREFITEAQRIDPNVTDLPVTYLESMNEVIKAFQQAFSIAFLATTLILLVVLRNLKDTLLVLLPLMLASLFTAAATVIFDVPFNFANIIALPLLFGLGVDSGIHMAHRLHEIEREGGNLLGTSEAKGVFYGALTTVFSFLSLALTSHRGTASMGLLLSIGLMLTLVCALVVLPAFSGVRARESR